MEAKSLLARFVGNDERNSLQSVLVELTVFGIRTEKNLTFNAPTYPPPHPPLTPPSLIPAPNGRLIVVSGYSPQSIRIFHVEKSAS